MTAPTAPWVLRCPVCSTPVADAVPGGPTHPAHPGAPCRTCGLPAAAHAGMVVGRIGVTLTELSRDRDALLATLRTHATAPVPAPAPAVAPSPVPAPVVHSWAPPPPPGPGPRPPVPPVQGPPVPGLAAQDPRSVRRRISPQQVLVGLGSLLVVAAALVLVAVAWTRFGIGFQAAVMGTATAAAAAGSGWAARRGLRATEEGLAATATALLLIDVCAARALGLLGLDAVDGLLYGALATALVAVLTAGLARTTPTTLVWPAAALLAAQPVLPLLSGYLGGGASTVAALLVIGAADVAVAGRLPRWTGEVARVLAGTAAALAVLRGTELAWVGGVPDGVAATALLVVGAAGAVVVVVRWAGRGLEVPFRFVAGVLAAAPSLAVAGLVLRSGPVGGPVLGLTGVVLATTLVLVRRSPLQRELAGGAGAVLLLAGLGELVVTDRPAAVALVLLAGVAPAALTAVLVAPARSTATAAVLALPGLATLCARAGDVLPATTAGLLLAALAALALGLATLRHGQPEEWAAALTAPGLALAAAGTGASIGAWGQVGAQLGVVGAAGLAYGLVSGRTVVRWTALADLVLAGWTALAGAAITTPEAYSLPLAAALLAAAGPRLLRGPSWAGWGPGLLVGFAPSGLAAVADDGPLRVVLVLAAGVVAVVAGALTHRQAPFLVGAGALAVLGTVELAPVVSRLDSWVPLGAAGLLLLVVGATYERRRQQAREAVAWVGQMS
ncbi:hypothetical protein TEK04_06605 [Klenkia sp. LSe6-5]|uniref:DUF2157 domain-containing protein n=1 Tax=Klenkia sesuvii TaxID=3103137 RepID=A0ABU8DR98_9ACTN